MPFKLRFLRFVLLHVLALGGVLLHLGMKDWTNSMMVRYSPDGSYHWFYVMMEILFLLFPLLYSWLAFLLIQRTTGRLNAVLFKVAVFVLYAAAIQFLRDFGKLNGRHIDFTLLGKMALLYFVSATITGLLLRKWGRGNEKYDHHFE